MSRGSRRAVAAALVLLMAGELALPGAEARRKRRRQRNETDQAAQKEPPSPACPPAGCEPGLHLVLEEEEQPPRAVASFRYRVRIGEQRLEGGCPPSRDDPPSGARCVAGGVFVPFSPSQADVVIEAAGFRPLLQTLTPSYEDRCCPRARLRLILRRESS